MALQFTEPVKFLGTETRSGKTKDGKDYSMTEAKLFVPDLGRIKVIVHGKPKFPELAQHVQLRLSVDQGRYQSVQVVYDENSVFTVIK
jgi:hypothetical protein